MPKTRDNYQITGSTVDEVVRNLNFLLQRIGDRLDKIEGIRGDSAIESSLAVTGDIEADADVTVSDTDGNVIHSLE